MVTFAVPGVPVPQGSKILFRGRMIDVNQAKLRAWRKAIRVSSESATKPHTFSEPVHLEVEFRFPRPKYHFGTGKNALKLKPNAPTIHSKKPDLDKLIRAVGDALTEASLITDDCLIAKVTASKVYGSPGATITVKPLVNDPEG